MKRISPALAATIALLTPALADPAGLQCPKHELAEVRRKPPVPDGIATLLPPLMILNILDYDSLSRLPTSKVTFRVVDQGGRTVPNALVGVIFKDRMRFLAEGAAGGAPTLLPQGAYIINAAAVAKDGTVRYGSVEDTIFGGSPTTITVRLTGQVSGASTTAAAPSVSIGASLPVEVKGPLRDKSVLAVVRHGVNARAQGKPGEKITLAHAAVSSGADPAVLLPGKEGKYDVVNLLCAPRVQLGRWTVEAKRPSVKIEAPDSQPIGSVLNVTVSGNLNSGHRIAIGPTERPGTWTTRTFSASGHEQFAIKLPYEAGAYIIRVSTHDGTVLAHRAVKIGFAPIGIEGPDRITLGDRATFTWPDKAISRLRLQLWTLAQEGKPARFVAEVDDRRAIAGPGDYELRLLSRSGEGTVLGRKPFSVTGAAFAKAPPDVKAGARFTAEMSFDAKIFDKVKFVERGRDPSALPSLRVERARRIITAEAPATPGSYDLVYFIGGVRTAVEAGRVPIEVRAP